VLFYGQELAVTLSTFLFRQERSLQPWSSPLWSDASEELPEKAVLVGNAFATHLDAEFCPNAEALDFWPFSRYLPVAEY
jgi:hypothetical protein